MGRKTKLKGSRIWSFISSPHTIKEVCTTAVFNKTEREKRTKIVLASIGTTIFFFPRSLFFLKWRLGKISVGRSGRNTKKELHQLTERRRECKFMMEKTKEEGTEWEKEKESMIGKNLDEPGSNH